MAVVLPFYFISSDTRSKEGRTQTRTLWAYGRSSSKTTDKVNSVCFTLWHFSCQLKQTNNYFSNKPTCILSIGYRFKIILFVNFRQGRIWEFQWWTRPDVQVTLQNLLHGYKVGSLTNQSVIMSFDCSRPSSTLLKPFALSNTQLTRRARQVYAKKYFHVKTSSPRCLPRSETQANF